MAGSEGGDERSQRRKRNVSQDAVPAWEDPSLRRVLPVELRFMLGDAESIVAVPRNVAEKIEERHPLDSALLSRWGEILIHWELAGISPKDPTRIEIYGRIEGIWFTTIIARDRPHILTTFHRMKVRKMESRIRAGYLRRKGSDSCPDEKDRDLQSTRGCT